jgi:hypothetical protein
MKITEIIIHPANQNPVVEYAKAEGDFNLLNPMLDQHCKSLDRKKIDYIFKIEGAPANYYKFNLKTSNFNSFIKYIPDLQKTW